MEVASGKGARSPRRLGWEMSEDFTAGSFGIRVGDGYCVVIEKKPGVHGWVEDGRRFSLPLPEDFDNLAMIPEDRLGLVVRAYELEHRGDGLRHLLTHWASDTEG